VDKAVTPELRANRWLVYDRYEWQPFKGERRWDAYAVVPHKKARRSATSAVVRSKKIYAPLIDTPDLLKRFADLADGEVTQDVWKSWIADYGTLGLQKGVNPSRGGPAESFSAFVQEARAAGDLLRLYEAAADPTAVDEDYIRQYLFPYLVPPEGVSAARNAALFLVDVVVQEKLEKECFPRFHPNTDGTAMLSHGFRSLLGAMYLQMAFLRSGMTAARFCQGPGCNRTIALSTPETEEEYAKRLARGERKPSKTYDNKVYHSPVCKQAAYRARKKRTLPDSK
jgi:hypothetical protein